MYISLVLFLIEISLSVELRKLEAAGVPSTVVSGVSRDSSKLRAVPGGETWSIVSIGEIGEKKALVRTRERGDRIEERSMRSTMSGVIRTFPRDDLARVCGVTVFTGKKKSDVRIMRAYLRKLRGMERNTITRRERNLSPLNFTYDTRSNAVVESSASCLFDSYRMHTKR